MIFTPLSELSDIVGKVQFGADELRYVADASGIPPMRARCAVKRDDGGYDLYGTMPRKGVCQRIVRCRTYDGIHLEGAQIVWEERQPGPRRWMGEADIAYDEQNGRFLALLFASGEPWHKAWALTSDDGTIWRLAHDAPVYQDQDALGLIWDGPRDRFLCCQTTYQPFPDRRILDNLGEKVRRSLHVLTSTDGVRWGHDVAVALRQGVFVPAERAITADADDPPDLEFYRLTPFAYGGMVAGMMMNYAASPDAVNPHFPPSKHGPQLSAEWWISPDGQSWRRPYRDVFAAGQASQSITHNPMELAGEHRWVIGGKTFGLPLHQLFHVAALSNAEFSTPPFELPREPLRLTADLCFHGRRPRGFRDQSYLMAELRDESGHVIEGFAKEQCIFRAGDALPSLLRWNTRLSSDLTGRRVVARFYLRDARIYSLDA